MLEEKKNILVDHEKGSIIVIIRVVKKNNIVEIPSEIELAELGKEEKVSAEVIEELKKLRN